VGYRVAVTPGEQTIEAMVAAMAQSDD